MNGPSTGSITRGFSFNPVIPVSELGDVIRRREPAVMLKVITRFHVEVHNLITIPPNSPASLWIGKEDEGRTGRKEGQVPIPGMIASHVFAKTICLLGRRHRETRYCVLIPHYTVPIKKAMRLSIPQRVRLGFHSWISSDI